MSLDSYGESETDDYVADQVGRASRTERLLRKLFGDPRSAPSRIGKIVLFVFISLVCLGVWAVGYQNLDSSGSSLWFFQTLVGILQSWWLPPVISLYVYYKYIGLRRSWAARKAANMTGWLVETVTQLSDEMRSTDHMRPVIAASDMDQDEIATYLDKALDGEPHGAEDVDYWSVSDIDETPDSDATDTEDAIEDDTPAIAAEFDRDDIVDGATDAEQLAFLLEHANNQFVAAYHETCQPEIGDLSQTDAAVDDVPSDESSDHGYAERIYGALTGLVGRGDTEDQPAPPTEDDEQQDDGSDDTGYIADPFADPSASDSPSPRGSGGRADVPDGERGEIPWRVAIGEELKQFTLHLTAAFESGAVMWRLGLPYAIAAAIQFVYAGVWVGPLTAAVILFGTSPLVALGTMHSISQLRSHRIERHRQPTGGEYWDAQMALVKTVETADVTCYMGRAAGRSYASYDREEFIDELSLRLWQMTTRGEEVAPSVMEQYARNLKQMKPNLPGQLRNVEIPSINREIKSTVEDAEDKIITKAKLAHEVITNADDTRFGRNLGHNPKLVRKRYREMAEEEHSLSETTLTTETASGEEVELKLVYPADKRRLPEMSQLQSRFSERFMGAHGEPIYSLPDVDPREHLHGVNVPQEAYEKMPDPPELPEGDGSDPKTRDAQIAD